MLLKQGWGVPVPATSTFPYPPRPTYPCPMATLGYCHHSQNTVAIPGTSRSPQGHHCHPWDIVAISGTPWPALRHHCHPWDTMATPGTLQPSLGHHATPGCPSPCLPVVPSAQGAECRGAGGSFPLGVSHVASDRDPCHRWLFPLPWLSSQEGAPAPRAPPAPMETEPSSTLGRPSTLEKAK